MNVSFFGEIEQRDVSSKGPKPDKPLTFEKAKSEITFLDLAVEPLSFTKNDLPKAVGDKVAPSLDQAFALALRELGNRLA
jgi:hypothetical protein